MSTRTRMSARSPALKAADLARKQIEQDIAAGKTVVADRYAFSGIAFSAAKVRPSLVVPYNVNGGSSLVPCVQVAHEGPSS